MEKLEDVEIIPLQNPKYIIPYRMNYKQNGIQKTWEALKEHESVCILIYNKTRDCFVFVSQFRPAVYLSAVRHAGGDTTDKVDTNKYPAKLGITYELCAGLVDKENASRAEHAKMEVLEECGYDVPVDSLEVISTYRTSTGMSGSYQILYFVEVTDEQKVSAGGGVNSELIYLVEVPRSQAVKEFIDGTSDVPMNVIFKFGFLWFHARKDHLYR